MNEKRWNDSPFILHADQSATEGAAAFNPNQVFSSPTPLCPATYEVWGEKAKSGEEAQNKASVHYRHCRTCPF